MRDRDLPEEVSSLAVAPSDPSKGHDHNERRQTR
jgi:hypothetical protein